jgi:hypothetical protein
MGNAELVDGMQKVPHSLSPPPSAPKVLSLWFFIPFSPQSNFFSIHILNNISLQNRLNIGALICGAGARRSV